MTSILPVARAALCALLLLGAPTASLAQSPAAPVSESVWKVKASWEATSFNWVFWSSGRYLDTDGPTGTWKQSGADLTLQAAAGHTYKGVIKGDDMTGTVVLTKTGAPEGTFTAHRLGGNAPPIS